MSSANPGGLGASQQIEQARRQLQALYSQRIAQLGVVCFFQKPVVQYKCSPNGPPVAPAEYLVCRYKQLCDGAARLKSEAMLQALLDEMEQDIVDTPLDSVADLLAKYGAQLGAYSVSGFDLGSFIFLVMAQCFHKAKREADRELNLPNTPLGVAKMLIQQLSQP